MSFSEGGFRGDESFLGKIRKKAGEKALPILTAFSVGLGSQACEQVGPLEAQTLEARKDLDKSVENFSEETKKINAYEEILKTATNELYRVRMGGVEAGEKKYFQRIYKDKDYRLKVKKMIEKYSEESGVPLDTAISFVALESGFDNNAKISVPSKEDPTKEVTAVGACQLRVPAAKKVGLKVDEEKGVDERYILDKNIKGGMETLANYYENFENWPLALTAYSHGRAGVCRKLNNLFPELTLNKRQDDFDDTGKDLYLEKLINGDLKIEHLYMLDRTFFKYAMDVVAISDLANKYINDDVIHTVKTKSKTVQKTVVADKK